MNANPAFHHWCKEQAEKDQRIRELEGEAYRQDARILELAVERDALKAERDELKRLLVDRRTREERLKARVAELAAAVVAPMSGEARAKAISWFKGHGEWREREGPRTGVQAR